MTGLHSATRAGCSDHPRGRGQRGPDRVANNGSSVPSARRPRRRQSRRSHPSRRSARPDPHAERRVASYQECDMANFLNESTQRGIARLLQLGWSHRRIARGLKVDRETVARNARQALPGGVAARRSLRAGRMAAPTHSVGLVRSADDVIPDRDGDVEQLRPLARVLLLQARAELAMRAAGATQRTKRADQRCLAPARSAASNTPAQ